MPFSHHSHSGQFCGHAVDTLEECIQAAISKGMTTFCMTEHIPRDRMDFYPEEENVHTPESLRKLFDDYVPEAKRLQQKYRDQIDLFVGFEGEWIRGSTLPIMQDLLERYDFDLFVGSVHHVHTIPYDITAHEYRKAREVSGGTDERIFEDYFDAQFDMLRSLHPPIVGHLDLIKLFCDDPKRSFRTWDGVWERVMRNLKFIVEYGGVMELNSGGFRKGMGETFPGLEICKEFKALGGRFTVSDDSHGVAQVGSEFDKALDFTREVGITEVCCLASVSEGIRMHDQRFPKVGWRTISTKELEKHAFWGK